MLQTAAFYFLLLSVLKRPLQTFVIYRFTTFFLFSSMRDKLFWKMRIKTKAALLFISSSSSLCKTSLCLLFVNLRICSLKINQYLKVQLHPVPSWFMHPPHGTEKLKNKHFSSPRNKIVFMIFIPHVSWKIGHLFCGYTHFQAKQ